MADLAGKSLIAKLTVDGGDGFFPVGYTVGSSILGNGGWLIQQGQPQDDALFRFDFMELMGGWLHCDIIGASGTAYEGAKVGLSSSGALGFYKAAKVKDVWRVDLQGNMEKLTAFEFRLLAYTGQQVRIISNQSAHFSRAQHLNACDGVPARFRADIVAYL